MIGRHPTVYFEGYKMFDDYDAGVDVWSLGVTMFETFAGILPFDVTDDDVADHRDNPMWLGEKLDLNIAFLEI